MINQETEIAPVPLASQILENSRLAEARNLIDEIRSKCTTESIAHQRGLEDIVSLLMENEVDRDTIAVSVLRGLRNSLTISNEQIRKKFKPSVADLYQGAEKLDAISFNIGTGRVQSSASNKQIDFSRILVAMVDDPRVVVIHLAELLVQMREAKLLSEEEQRSLAKQVVTIYTPLANKLGMWRFKWELEDLSFKYTNRTEFNRIARQLDGRRIEREEFINLFVDQLQILMDKSNISAQVNGRAKHVYSIWQKLNQKGMQLNHLFDVRAVRILVDDIASCYAALGAVHASWSAVNNEFDDYIAVPKPNGYRSLHTAIYGPDSKIVEVQIRTKQMHNDSEFGVAAHWIYKEDSKSGLYQEGKIRLLRQLMAWKDEVTDVYSSQTDESSSNLLANTYVFTPAGKVVELPANSTPIDFAYSIHTEVGHRCRGAIVNGRMVPLTHVLGTGDWVEIQTVKSGGPSRDWLTSQHKFAVSAKARACIRRWFKLEEYGRYEAQGRTILDKEIAKHGLSKVNYEKLALANGYKNSQVFLAAIGMKELKPAHAIVSLTEQTPVDQEIKLPKRSAELDTPPLSISGISNLLTNHASCCGPLPGDDVIGYVTVSRGITIHKRDCGNIARMLEMHPERLVPVDWEFDRLSKYSVDIELYVEEHSKLLQEITATTSEMGINLIALNTTHIKQNNIDRISLTVEISTADEVRNLLARLRGMSQVIRARRVDY